MNRKIRFGSSLKDLTHDSSISNDFERVHYNSNFLALMKGHGVHYFSMKEKIGQNKYFRHCNACSKY